MKIHLCAATCRIISPRCFSGAPDRQTRTVATHTVFSLEELVYLKIRMEEKLFSQTLSVSCHYSNAIRGHRSCRFPDAATSPEQSLARGRRCVRHSLNGWTWAARLAAVEPRRAATAVRAGRGGRKADPERRPSARWAQKGRPRSGVRRGTSRFSRCFTLNLPLSEAGEVRLRSHLCLCQVRFHDRPRKVRRVADSRRRQQGRSAEPRQGSQPQPWPVRLAAPPRCPASLGPGVDRQPCAEAAASVGHAAVL